MFGSKKPSAPRPLNDSGRSLISETFSLEGTLRTSGAIDIAGLIKGPVYTNDLIIKETGSVVGPIETDKIEIYGHLEGKIVAKTIVIGRNLPAVLVYFSLIGLPSLFIVSYIEIILECKLIDLFSKACSISSILEKIPFGFLSFSSA